MVNEICSRSHCGVAILTLLPSLLSNLELSAEIVYYCVIFTSTDFFFITNNKADNIRNIYVIVNNSV